MMQRAWTGTDLSGFLGELDAAAAPAPAPFDAQVLASYRASAAVLAGLDQPAELKPWGARSTGSPEAGAEALSLLEADLVPTASAAVFGGTSMLSFDVRRAALRELGTQDRLLAALAANPQERNGPLQQTLEHYIQGRAEPLRVQTPAQQALSLQAILWLEGLALPGLPTLEEARRTVAWTAMVKPFKRLAGDHFRGRTQELDRLRNFVGVLDAQTLKGRLQRHASRLLRLDPKPALSLHGPGGMGKTALVMRFFLEHLEAEESQRVPFAYIDFDSPFIKITRLSTIATEMLRQLGMQYPGLPGFPVPTLSEDTEQILQTLAGALNALSERTQQPYLVVLDTFEEVQYGGEGNAVLLWDLLERLQAGWPFMRVLVSGRAPVKLLRLGGLETESMPLEGIDDAAAMALLRSGGVESEELAQALVKQVGRVPLSLHLAAEVVAREGADARRGGVRDLRTSAYLLFSVSDEVIQGQLYERILGHIHDEDVVKLAHPGLVLRCITADLILQVLKEPCGLSITALAQAQRLYDELGKEAALVAEENGNTLRHRQDLRRTMLQLLTARSPALAQDIHRRAAQYHACSSEATAAAEEIYHRLMLGEALPAHLDPRHPEVRTSLTPSLRELPLAGQLLLAGLGYDVPADVLSHASQAQRDQHLASQLQDLLQHGAPALKSAESVLSGVSFRGKHSPLYLQSARLMLLQARYAEATELLEEGLALASADQDLPAVLDQLALRAWVLECCARWDDVATALPYVQDYAQRLQREPEQAQVLAQELRLAERRGDAEAAAAAAKALAARLLQLPLQVLHGLEVLMEGTQERVLRIAPELAPILLNIPGPQQVVPYLRAAAPNRA